MLDDGCKTLFIYSESFEINAKVSIFVYIEY
jgi:hypothetical protein